MFGIRTADGYWRLAVAAVAGIAGAGFALGWMAGRLFKWFW